MPLGCVGWRCVFMVRACSPGSDHWINKDGMASVAADIRQYTGSQHTYVLTAMFRFQTIMEQFRHVLEGVHPDDVAHVGMLHGT
eukprot:3540252-Pyramimonas_sp.AAC.1